MMKKLLLPLAAVALMATSCSTDVKDSHTTINYTEYNLIEDITSQGEAASASETVYQFTYNLSRNVVSINAPEIIIDNQKIAFETDTMRIQNKVFGEQVAYMGFSSSRNVGKGASVTNLNGYLPSCYVPLSSNLLSSNYKFECTYTQRLQLDYVLNDRYHITTFWPQACYVGKTYVSDGSTYYTTNDTGIFVNLNFSKKLATVYLLGVKLSVENVEKAPKVILMEEIPITMTHNSYYLEAASPKTSIPGEKDNKAAFVETEDYKVTDFTLHLTSSDLTDAQISYKVDGKSVNFQGSSIVKSLN